MSIKDKVKISELPLATSTGGTDVLPIVQEGKNKKLSTDKLKGDSITKVKVTSDNKTGALSATGKYNKETDELSVDFKGLKPDFSNHILKQQGVENRGKVLKTDSMGNVVLGEDKVAKTRKLLEQIAVKEKVSGNPIVLDDSANGKLVDFKVKGSTYQAENPTPTEPKEVVNGVLKEIKIYGKNLFDLNELKTNSTEKLKVNGNAQNFTIKGIINEPVVILFSIKKQLHISGSWSCKKGGGYFRVTYTDGSVKDIFNSYENNQSGVIDFTTDEMKEVKNFSFQIFTFGRDFTIENLQIEYGSQATPYEPFKGQTITFSKPITLAQDESIEKVDGVYSKVTPTGATPLPLVDQQALESLQTFYSNATFTTDSGATLEIEYIADTNTYKLKQINELKTALVALEGEK